MEHMWHRKHAPVSPLYPSDAAFWPALPVFVRMPSVMSDALFYDGRSPELWWCPLVGRRVVTLPGVDVDFRPLPGPASGRG